MSILLEEVAYATQSQVDRGNQIIQAVRVLGSLSRNRRRYSEQAMRNSASLFEGKSVCIDHPDKSRADSSRSFLDAVGWLSNVRFERGAVYADLNLLESHPATATILERAEKNPKGFGLSINARGNQSRINGEQVVTKISEVASVDIVLDPATNISLFESLNRPLTVFEKSRREFQEHRTGQAKRRTVKLTESKQEQPDTFESARRVFRRHRGS